MARQSKTPVQFNRTTRGDRRVGMTSGRAGVVLPISYVPLLRGDSCSGQFACQIELAEMPKPVFNAVHANLQAWFVPKSAHPQFAGYDEFMHAYQGEQIKALGAADRDPPQYFSKLGVAADYLTFQNSKWTKTLGLHVNGGHDQGHNVDILDAYNLIWNFRAAAHSSRITRRNFTAEGIEQAVTLAPAFWPSGKFRHVVPDYERALILGNMDLDVTAGALPVSGIGISPAYAEPNLKTSAITFRQTGPHWTGSANEGWWNDDNGDGIRIKAEEYEDSGLFYPAIFAQMGGQSIGVSTADIDKARTTQAFAKLRTAYAGNDATGFDNDDAIVAELMQGFSVPDDMFKRPWLLDTKRVSFTTVERHATDAANLDASVSVGRAQASLSLNVPMQEVGGYIIITAEILPEQLHERQGDPAFYIDSVDDFPNALRDVQNPEPVDLVENWRVDNAHGDRRGLYGYEPQNARWDRDFTSLGGEYYQPDPNNPFTEMRSALWLAEVVDPEFSSDHYLAPADFPHDVFSDTLADAVQIAFRHNCSIRGLTQIGDVLAENNDDYDAVVNAGQPITEYG